MAPRAAAGSRNLKVQVDRPALSASLFPLPPYPSRRARSYIDGEMLKAFGKSVKQVTARTAHELRHEGLELLSLLDRASEKLAYAA